MCMNPAHALLSRSRPGLRVPNPAVSRLLRRDPHDFHRHGIVTIPIVLLGNIAVARPREMVGVQRHLLRRQHIEHLQPGGYCLFWVRIVDKLGPWRLGEKDLVVRRVAGEG
jgi:hypothetical protein